MIHCFSHIWDNNFFEEKRLIFQQAGEIPRSKPKNPAELLKANQALLAKLRADVDVPKTPVQSTHTDRRDTRELTKPTEDNTASAEIAQKAVELQGSMEAIEVQLMQSAHEKIYEQYMNPAFMQYLNQRGDAGKVYPFFDLVIKRPYDFDYKNKGNNRIEIVKRKPFTDKNKEIADDFLMVMETGDAQITKVNNLELKNEKGEIPWMSNAEYNKRMTDYRARFNNEIKRARGPKGKGRKKFRDVADSISIEMREIYALENIEFPKRFIALVKARNLSFEVNDPRFIDVVNHQALQGTSYEEITKYRFAPQNKLQVIVMAHPDFPDVYLIYTRNNYHNPLMVNKQGYMLTEQASGPPLPDPRYVDVKRRAYYEGNASAKTGLTDTEKERMKDIEKKIAAATPIHEKLRKDKEKRGRVEKAMGELDFDALKALALALSKPEWHKKINEQKNDKNGYNTLSEGIEAIFDDDPTKVDVAATQLNVDITNLSGPPAAPATPPATAPTTPPAAPAAGPPAPKPEKEILSSLDSITDPAFLQSIVDDLKPAGATLASGMMEQKKQLTQWLKDGEFSLINLQDKIAEVAGIR